MRVNDVGFKESLWSLSPKDLTSSEKRVQGGAKLHADHGISIDMLLGKLLNIKPDANGVAFYSTGSTPHANAIWGISQDVCFQTAIDLQETGSGFSAPGFECPALNGREVYSCESEPVEANPFISRLTFR